MLRFVRALAERESWRLALTVALLLLISFTEGVSLLLLVPLLELAGIAPDPGGMAAVTAALERILALIGVTPTLPLMLAVYIGVVALLALFVRWQRIQVQAIQESFSRSLRLHLYRAIAASSWRFFVTQRSSTFHHALTSELNRVRTVTSAALELIVRSVVALVYLGFALYLSVPVTLLAFGCGLGLTLLLRPMTLSARRKGRLVSRAKRELYGAIDEHLGGMRVAKSHGSEGAHLEAFSHLAHEVEDAYVDSARNRADVQFWYQLGAIVALSLVVLVAFQLLALPVATVMLLLFLFSRMLPMIAAVQSRYQALIGSLPAFEEVIELIATCEAASEAPAGSAGTVPLERELELRGASFTYEGGDRPALERVDLHVAAGQTTAIVGLSGAGKSTVADLLAGLLTPTEGALLIDGASLDPSRVHAWRRSLGYVAQETFLFHESVRHNLRITRPGASDEELFEALERASAAEFVRRLPQGLDTVVGDRGVRLSGGERQRLALARALLREPSLLILDEATSSLDAENERNVQQAIERLAGRMTMVIVTHRLATARKADLLYVVEDGRVTQRGSWEQLIGREGRFRRLCEAQGLLESAPAVPG